MPDGFWLCSSVDLWQLLFTKSDIRWYLMPLDRKFLPFLFMNQIQFFKFSDICVLLEEKKKYPSYNGDQLLMLFTWLNGSIQFYYYTIPKPEKEVK